MNGILSIVEGYNAGQVALLCVIGFFLVIAVLIVLVLLLTGFSKVFGKLESLGEHMRSDKTAGSAKASAPEQSVSEDDEVVAAITAAITAYYAAGADAEEAGEDVPPPFVIRSIKKS